MLSWLLLWLTNSRAVSLVAGRVPMIATSLCLLATNEIALVTVGDTGTWNGFPSASSLVTLLYFLSLFTQALSVLWKADGDAATVWADTEPRQTFSPSKSHSNGHRRSASHGLLPLGGVVLTGAELALLAVLLVMEYALRNPASSLMY